MVRRQLCHGEKVNDPGLGLGTRVFVRNRRVVGRNKIQDNWDSVPHQVVARPDPEGPVYTVEPLVGNGPRKTLHRREILEARGQDEDGVQRFGAPARLVPPVPARRQPRSWLSGGFTPCRHLRPSSGREHTIVTYSVLLLDYLMNETRRKPTTGRQSPTLFDKWHGIFYMPSRIDEAGHTKAFDDPVAEHWGESQRAKRSLVGLDSQGRTPCLAAPQARVLTLKGKVES